MKEEEKKVDGDRVAEMRRLLQEGGDAAVERRFGTSAQVTEEYRVAQRQRAAARRRAEEQRRRIVEQRQKRERDQAKAKAPDSPEARRVHAAGREDQARRDVGKADRAEALKAKLQQQRSMREQMQATLRRRREQDRDCGMSR